MSGDEKGLYVSSDTGTSFTKIPTEQRAHLFAFGKPEVGSTIMTLFVYGRINGENGIFRPVDKGKTWIRINDETQKVSNVPNSMEGDRQTFGRVYIGTNGRGIYYGEPLVDP